MALLLLLAAAHVLAIVVFEGLTPFQALWLTMTTITTVGYGDLVAETIAGRLSTILLVYLGGIWIAFQSAATYFEYRADRRERRRRGRWKWHMTDHILLLNVPAQDTAYLHRLLKEFQASRRFRRKRVQVVSTGFPEGLPDSLSEMGLVHYSGYPWDSDALRSASAADADVIAVFAESDSDVATDGRTLDIIDRLRDIGAEGRILAECVDDRNRPRFKRFGADLVVRPLRGYPEMIVRALAAPGAEQILEDLFTSRGDEVWRYDVCVSGWPWGELVSALVKEDIGVPIAFRRSIREDIIINPMPDVRIEADKIYVLVREGNARPDKDIAALLARRRPRAGD